MRVIVDTHSHIPTCFYFIVTPQPTSVTHTCYLHVYVYVCVSGEIVQQGM